MKNFWKHFKTVCKHKYVVFKECRACGITRQGIIHDMSKFSPAEFITSAKYYQGTKSPIEAEKEDIGYSVAWLHHKGRNKHHWEWWTDYSPVDGSIIANKIPVNYVIEMVCDWVGASKVYNGVNWTQADPLKYYHKVRAGRHLHPATEKMLIELLTIINDCGLDLFHTVCRNRYPFIFREYECANNAHQP